MAKKIIFLVFLLGGIYLIVVLSRDLWKVLRVRNRIVEAEDEVERLTEKKDALEQELSRVSSDEFVEREARDKLLLSREGETVVLLPEMKQLERVERKEQVEENGENWEKWVKLFVY